MTTDVSRKRALIVLTSHGELGDTGRPTGFYLPEVAHPWRVFTAAGMAVDLVSVEGGEPPMDGVDRTDAVQQAFLDDPEMAAGLRATATPGEIDPAGYDVVLYAGGHGVMWDFPGNTELAALGRRVYERDGVVAAVCHGPAGLVDLTLSDGSYLVDGKQVAAFTNAEEAAVGLTEVVPFLLADKLVERGAKHVPAPDFQPQTITDGRLVTGQNPASAIGVAEAVVAVLHNLDAERR
jgi:putative intracellular protease/amidase